MSRFGFFGKLHCRWCGTAYMPKKPRDRDGFDKPSCKQAHHRAYKKYVTRTTRQKPGSQAKSVTHKKPRTEASPGTGKRNRNCRDCSRLDWADTGYRADHKHKTHCKLPNKKPRVLDEESPCKDFRQSTKRKKRKK